MAVDLAELTSLHASQVRETDELNWDEPRQRVVARKVTRLGALQLSVRETQAPRGAEATKLLLQAVRRHGLDCLPWNDVSRQLQARLSHAARLEPDGGWPRVVDEWLEDNLEDWLLP